MDILPPGKLRTRLQAAVESLFAAEFAVKIWPFDEEAARVFPEIVSHCQAIGRPVSHFDALIASICRARVPRVATRDTADFEDSGIPIINTWRE